MKNNAAQREFKKYKSQINQIEEIVEHSKPGALLEHESSIRKKLKHLKELENQSLKGYKGVYERYEELLEMSQRDYLIAITKRIIQNLISMKFYVEIIIVI